MKVLLLNNLYAPYFFGGAERSVQFLAEALVNAGHNVIVISAKPGRHTDIAELGGAKVHFVGLKNLYWPFSNRRNPAMFKPFWHAVDTHNPLMAYEFSRILDCERPDIVHTNNVAGFSTAVWKHVKSRGLPLVHTLRDYYLMCPGSEMFRRGRNCDRRCMQCKILSTQRRRATRLVDTVVGISKFILERHLEHGYFKLSRYSRVIYNAYEAADPLPASAKQQVGLLRLGYLGRLAPIKGIELLLKTIAANRALPISLTVAGTGRGEYEKLLQERYPLQNVDYLGYVRPETFFRSIDVLIVPSLWQEPMGRVVVESFSHGVPVVGSRRGGIPELIDEHSTGYLFEPSQPHDLTSVLLTCIENRRALEEMRPRCLLKAAQFLPTAIISQYLQTYDQLIRSSTITHSEGNNLHSPHGHDI